MLTLLSNTHSVNTKLSFSSQLPSSTPQFHFALSPIQYTFMPLDNNQSKQMNHNDFIGHLHFLESQTDIPFFSRTNFFESTLSPSSNQSIPFNKVYQEKLNTKTFLSSIWHLRFIKSFPHQQFEAIETERRTRLPVKLSLAIQHHYSTHITALNKAKFKTKSCIGQIQFTISFLKPIAPSISTCTGINREFRLAHTDHFNINITVYNEQTKIDKVTITSHLDHSSSTSTDLSNVASFLNANNNDTVNLILHISIDIVLQTQK